MSREPLSRGPGTSGDASLLQSKAQKMPGDSLPRLECSLTKKLVLSRWWFGEPLCC